MHIGVVAAAEAYGDMVGAARKIHQLTRGVKAQVDVGKFAPKRADARSSHICRNDASMVICSGPARR